MVHMMDYSWYKEIIKLKQSANLYEMLKHRQHLQSKGFSSHSLYVTIIFNGCFILEQFEFLTPIFKS
jgi:transketolase N-terminal domain/subunit